MKTNKQGAFLSALIFCACIAVAADLTSTNKEADLPAFIGIYTISQEVREEANKLATTESRIAYLSSVIASNAVDTSAVENFRKSSALRLMGIINSTNTIPVLVSNLTFVDAKLPVRPAVEALAKIGEPAVPCLLEALKDPSASSEKVELIVQELRFIKKAQFDPENRWGKFVEENKGKLPPELRGRLDRIIWVDD